MATMYCQFSNRLENRKAMDVSAQAYVEAYAMKQAWTGYG